MGITHIHINLVEAMKNPKFYLILFGNADGGELTIEQLMEHFESRRKMGFTKLVLSEDCNHFLPDGSCAGHEGD